MCRRGLVSSFAFNIIVLRIVQGRNNASIERTGLWECRVSDEQGE